MRIIKWKKDNVERYFEYHVSILVDFIIEFSKTQEKNDSEYYGTKINEAIRMPEIEDCQKALENMILDFDCGIEFITLESNMSNFIGDKKEDVKYCKDMISLNPSLIDEIIDNKSILDEHVDTIFSEYCKIFGIQKAYGIEKWEKEVNKLYIKQDTSCRGCYNSQDHYLPVEWLYLSGNDLTIAIQTAFEKEK